MKTSSVALNPLVVVAMLVRGSSAWEMAAIIMRLGDSTTQVKRHGQPLARPRQDEVESLRDSLGHCQCDPQAARQGQGSGAARLGTAVEPEGGGREVATESSYVLKPA